MSPVRACRCKWGAESEEPLKKFGKVDKAMSHKPEDLLIIVGFFSLQGPNWEQSSLKLRQIVIFVRLHFVYGQMQAFSDFFFFLWI